MKITYHTPSSQIVVTSAVGLIKGDTGSLQPAEQALVADAIAARDAVIGYETRAEAAVANIPAVVKTLRAGALAYRRDAAGTALTTADGQKWSPLKEVTPQHFGAVADGATDDTPAFLAAIASGAKEIIVPGEAGEVYSVTAFSIAIPITLSGRGKPTLKARDRTGNGPLMVNVVSTQDVTIRGIVFDGNASVVTGFHNVTQVYQSTDVLFENCGFINCKGIAALVSGGLRVNYSGCWFFNCGMHHLISGLFADQKQGIAYTASSVSPSVDNCRFEKVGLDFVSFAGGTSDIRLTRNRAIENYAGGFYFFGVTGGLVANNIISNGAGGRNGFDISNTTDLTVTGNRAYNCGASGILIAGSCQNITVTGNVCFNNSQSTQPEHLGGITLDLGSGSHMKNITLSGNTCYDTQGPGAVTQRYAIGIRDNGGTFERITVDSSNDLTGYNASGNPDSISMFQSHKLGIVGFPYVFNLADQAEAILYTATGIQGEFDIINTNTADNFGKFFARSHNTPLKLLDPANQFVTTDTGTTFAVYRDATTNTVRLRNRAGVTRTFVVVPLGALRH